MTLSNKGRKLKQVNRVFQDKWTESYFFTYVEEKAFCLICQEKISSLKEYNLKRHYYAKHSAKYSEFIGPIRQNKVIELEKGFKKQQNSFKKLVYKSSDTVRASYIISKILAKHMKPFSDGEIVKECLEAVSGIYFPDKKQILPEICLSRRTITRRVEEMAEDIENSLKIKISELQFISLALDESTDISDTVQLAVFIRGVDIKFNITEEFAYLAPMKGTTTGKDLYQELKEVMKKLNIPMEKISGISTDGARAMSGRIKGLSGLFYNEFKRVTGNDLIVCHCLLHQEVLCSKILKMQNVIPRIIKIINFIRSTGLNHRQFKELLFELDSEYEDVLYHTEIRWLSRGKMLKRFYDLKVEIQQFLDMRQISFPEFNDKQWMTDLAFCIDITSHLNALNISLQGKDSLVTELFEKIKSFEKKLQLWRNQLENNNMYYFPTLRNEIPQDSKKYVNIILDIQIEFEARFQDFREHETSFALFASPFDIAVDEVLEGFQMELIELQCNADLKQKFRYSSLMDFYKLHFPVEKYSILANHAMKIISLFGSTYLCEQVFSKMKIIKSSVRNRLIDCRLRDCLRIAVSGIPPNIDKLVDRIQSSFPSNSNY